MGPEVVVGTGRYSLPWKDLDMAVEGGDGEERRKERGKVDLPSRSTFTPLNRGSD